MRRVRCLLLVSLGYAPLAFGEGAAQNDPGLLFELSGEHGFTADYAAGQAAPNFLDDVDLVPDGAQGQAFRCHEHQRLSYWAAGNIYAQRGTLALFWRARDPLGPTPFPIFRVGYADHSSWDMVFLRIDYNGHGFDAFVTDANLARTRVSYRSETLPRPDQWVHLALAWDETQGIRFYVDGRLVGRQDTTAVYDGGLDQFGPHSRVISPHQVTSAYQFVRTGDFDELRIYDRMLGDEGVARLAHKQAAAETASARRLDDKRWRDEWWLRYGWNRPDDPPPYLADAATRVRKVEIHDAFDLKQWGLKGTDGIRETTWPQVYNHSRLPGRSDSIILPDSNCYSLSGKAVTFMLPDEPWNQIEISGAAYGAASHLVKVGAKSAPLFVRPKDQERTVHRLAQPLRGGQLRFENEVQETPIGELEALRVTPGVAPQGVFELRYTLGSHSADNPSLKALVEYVQGRFMTDERATLVATPGAPTTAPTPAAPAPESLPLVHVLVPFEFRLPEPATVPDHPSYTWENANAGLDGIALDLPPLALTPTHGGLIPMNIQIKDPIWPLRNLLDFSFSVKPNEARSLWLDTRDRVLPNGYSLYLTVASASPGFGVTSLQGARLRLIFKERQAALVEQEADRFAEVRDNESFMCEERPNTKRLRLYERFSRDMEDLFRARPDHIPGRYYWYAFNPEQGRPPFQQPQAPAGVPLWAFRQVEVLKNLKRCFNWWIDNRQIENGELGGGLSDDGDFTNQWPAAVLMGVTPEKITRSLLKMMDAYYDQGMFTDGLATIMTDELHSYEDGISVIPQTMLVDYGSPKVVERLMSTARAVERLTGVNAAGHRHFISDYYSGTTVAHESIWQWSRPNSHLVLHPSLALVEWNGNPRARQLVVDLADGCLAHRRRRADGTFFIPDEIHFTTDTDRSEGPHGVRLQNLFWAAYRFTGDAKYLAPLMGDIEHGTVEAAEFLNADLLDLLGKRDDWGRRLAAQVTPETRSDFLRHLAWQVSGDKRYIETSLADMIQVGAQDMYMATEGHLWTDRVYMPSSELQRERLGGVALLRNRTYPGHVVSWEFKKPASGESVAVLVPRALPGEAKVIVYNLELTPVQATMRAWDLEPGEWEIKSGVDRNGDGKADAALTTRALTLERTRGIELTFAPRQTTVLELRLKAPGKPLWERPDLGIDRGDAALRDGALHVRVHSLGSQDAPASSLALMDPAGRVVARADIPALAAPLDLEPKTVDVKLAPPSGRSLAGYRVVIDPAGALTEITKRNNSIDLR